MELEPGWLQKEMIAAGDSIRLNHHPQSVAHLAGADRLPVTDAEAERLYAGLAGRFKAWTGKDLRTFKLRDPGADDVQPGLAQSQSQQ